MTKKNPRKPTSRIEYKKILDAICFYLRGEPFNEKYFLDRLKIVDDIISDHCMEIPPNLKVKYSKRFTTE